MEEAKDFITQIRGYLKTYRPPAQFCVRLFNVPNIEYKSLKTGQDLSEKVYEDVAHNILHYGWFVERELTSNEAKNAAIKIIRIRNTLQPSIKFHRPHLTTAIARTMLANRVPLELLKILFHNADVVANFACISSLCMEYIPSPFEWRFFARSLLARKLPILKYHNYINLEFPNEDMFPKHFVTYVVMMTHIYAFKSPEELML